MDLYKIVIKNYRSISLLELKIQSIADRNCFILLGLNEAGKSNILKAIASPIQKIVYKIDCEKESQHRGDSIVISYFYKAPADFIKKQIEQIDIPIELLNELSLEEIERRIEITKDDKKTDSLWLTFNNINYEKYLIDTESTHIILNDEQSLEEATFEKSNKEYTQLDQESLDIFIETSLRNEINSQIHEIIYWTNSPQYLINEPINIQEFSKNTNISIPLKNIFSLAGINNDTLASRISSALLSGEERSELENILSDASTFHINKLWPEHPINIKIRIEETSICTIIIEDKDRKHRHFKMGQRSEGFKHFISILLTLSIQNLTHELTNKIILIDEPENSLHPSSIRYLREELLNISNNNILLIATHSIYMIDSKNLDRHFKVKKNAGTTTIEQIEKDNPYEEEVIYEALGTSIYELIEPNIIIFEGRTDKELFEMFTAKLKNKIKPCRISSIFASGSNNIPKYSKFFKQKIVKGYIVVDSDTDGRAAKKLVIKENDSLKKTSFELSDIISLNKKDITIEDLLPKEILESTFAKLYLTKILLDSSQQFLEQIKQFKHSHKIHNDGHLEIFKSQLLNNIKKDIKNLTVQKLLDKYPLYTKFIMNLHSKIKSV